MTAAQSPAGTAFTLVHAGKIRQLFEVGHDQLLMVASNKVSAFDVVMKELIPDKGRVLTAMTAFWCEELAPQIPTHLVSAQPDDIVARTGVTGELRSAVESGRSLLVRRAGMLPIECIVRGSLAGSALREYKQQGTINGTTMPEGLRLGDTLPEPMFTPSTKFTPTAECPVGHDENIDFQEAERLVGRQLAARAHDLCLDAFRRGQARMAAAGFVLADTKFELGVVGGQLMICDEILTPDSSRIWAAEDVEPGVSVEAFDKQPLRDWLEAQTWDKQPPPPHLPNDVVASTSRRYIEGYERVTGRRLDDWWGAT